MSIYQIKFILSHPQIQFVLQPNFNPKERAWYQSHFKNLEKDKNNNTQLTDIYKYFDIQPIYSMTMTQSMLNLNKEVEGIFCSDLIFKNSFIPKLNINIMIVNLNGTLILTNYKNIAVTNSSILTRIDDEEITGFTNDDWNSILNYYYNKKLNSTCKYQNLDILCRCCNQNCEVKEYQLFPYTFYDLQIEQEIESKIDFLLQTFNNDFQNMIYLTLAVSFGLILLQVILIYVIFLPMYQIIRQSFFFLKNKKSQNFWGIEFIKRTKQISRNYEKQSRLKKNSIDNSNVLMQFKAQFDTLFDRVLAQRKNINPQCQILQQFKYPRQSVHHALDIHQILKEDKILDNYYEQQTSNPRKIFREEPLVLELNQVDQNQ